MYQANSTTFSGRMMMTAGRGDLQINMVSEPQWMPGIPHIFKVQLLLEVREEKGMWKYPQWTWPVANLRCFMQTTRSPL